ncbi:MAG: ATP-grasp domain-containing protein [Alphaproteobacteria bacterium]|nr:ATP-grasp domain-containing protein [Alphaproteobacteria bacterium]
MSSVRTLLVANRGEIARRVIRTARARALSTAVVFSDADAGLAFVREADLAVRIGPGPAASSYLDPERILAAARRVGAWAVHPGYGFLAENADFAQAVVDAGFVWVGPTPEAIRAMGDKARARKLVAAHGVPVVPGYDGDAQDDATLQAEAARIGVPLLVKASAGGGGRGMRRVDDLAGLPEALASARREALAGFGDDRLLLERYVERPRHIEVQVLGDVHGHVLSVGERECSIQRRHQKVVEEAPSPTLTRAEAATFHALARRAAEAVGYVGAGTVEFVVGRDGQACFLEMNTRLQVEHPVTEAVHGLDLVAAQLDVAEGRSLLPDGDDLATHQAALDARARGHAIEVRLCAEDPLRGWMPASGRLVRVALEEADGIRVDGGYVSGDVVSPHYDSLLAKIIAWGPTREVALARLRAALGQAWVPGLPTNLSLLRDLAADEAMAAAALHTGFLAERDLPRAPPANVEEGALVATVWAWAHRRASGPAAPSAWRISGPAWERDRWRYLDEEVEVAWRAVGEGLEVRVGEAAPVAVQVHGVQGDVLRVECDGLVRSVRVASTGLAPGPDDGDTVYVHLGDGEAMVTLVPRLPAVAGDAAEPGSCTAPTPGIVRAVDVALGDRVQQGQRLVVLEAMKMEHVLGAPADGTVRAVLVEAGQAVDAGTLLVRLEPDEDPA